MSSAERGSGKGFYERSGIQYVPYNVWAVTHGKNPFAQDAPQIIRIEAYVPRETATIFKVLSEKNDIPMTHRFRHALGLTDFILQGGIVFGNEDLNIIKIPENDTLHQAMSANKTPDLVRFGIFVDPHQADFLLRYTTEKGVSLARAITRIMDVDFEAATKGGIDIVNPHHHK